MMNRKAPQLTPVWVGMKLSSVKNKWMIWKTLEKNIKQRKTQNLLSKNLIDQLVFDMNILCYIFVSHTFYVQ